MSLSQKIAAEVDDLVKTCAPPQSVTAEEGPHTIDLPIGRATAIGVECAGFEFRVANHDAMSINDLKSWGNRIAAKVTYLMEPLALQEADTVAGEVLLRSASPTPKPDRRSYYEVRLKGSGAMRFDRIAFDEATRQRGPTPCHFTNEVVERLVDDLVATAP
jgi:hypothetical protein